MTFTALSASQTRVQLEHRKIERHGPSLEAPADSVSGDEGWPLYLSSYAELRA
jgi:hypothetical protein